MGLFNFARSRGYRNFMAKLYGWGASIVILGALFKINHYPYADIMLIVGLGMESIIFFFSAFEPPHVEPDWSLVYPQLAGMYHTDGTGPQKPTQALDEMFEKAKIDQELLSSLGKGMQSLSENTKSLSNVTGASLATEEYINNIRGASDSASELTGSYKRTSEALSKDASVSEEYATSIKSASESASTLASSYARAAESVDGELDATNEFTGNIKAASESVNILAEHYAKSTEILSKTAESLDLTSVDGQAYNEQMKRVSENLNALNSVYELQLMASNKHVESIDQLKDTMSNFLESVSASSDKNMKFQEELDNLTERVTALNKVYGNMLSAMNVNLQQ